jgi:hypothetical protein
VLRKIFRPKKQEVGGSSLENYIMRNFMICTVKSRRLHWTGMGKQRMHRHIVGGYLWENVYLEDQDRNADNVKMYLKETGCEDDR